MIRRVSYIERDTTDPYRNLALEEYLLGQVRDDEVILYLWQNRNTVVIGKNQNAWKECRVEALEADGGYLARRLSGGGAVYHDLGNLNFTFLATKEHYAVERQLEVILAAVQALGIPAEKTGRNDLTAGGRKFSGNAFYESRGRCYHHGTIMVDVSGDGLSKYLHVREDKLKSKGVSSVRARVCNLTEYVPGLTIAQMKQELRRAMETVYGVPAERLELAERGARRIVGSASDGEAFSGNSTEESTADESITDESITDENITDESITDESITDESTIDESTTVESCLEKLTEKYASWEWKYGRNIPFTQEFGTRFPWGDFTVGLRVNRGVIEDCEVYSDAMDPMLAELVKGCLNGARYEKREVLRRVREGLVEAGYEPGQEQAADILSLMKSEL